MTQILHLSYDLRDRKNREVTSAVKNLIDITTQEFNPFVIDLVRVPRLKDEVINFKSDRHIMINVFGFSYGFLMLWSQKRAFKQILKLNNDGLINLKEFDIIHSHKLTFEGAIGYTLAKHLKSRLFISIRHTDLYIIKKRIDIKFFSKKIIKYASKIFIIAPYMRNKLKKAFGEKFYNAEIKEKLILLPNFIDASKFNPTHSENNDYFITAFWMTYRYLRIKNVKRIFKAIREINDSKFLLKIIGDGEAKAEVIKYAKQAGVFQQIEFLGAVDNALVSNYISNAKAFLLPSTAETFGIVYAESLLCGIPILYSKGTGFDGFFENVGIAVNPHSVKSISEGIKNIIRLNDFFRSNISILQKQDKFNIFTKKFISDTYRKAIEEILKN